MSGVDVKTSTIVAVLALAGLAISGAANAQGYNPPGYYAGLQGQYVTLRDADYTDGLAIQSEASKGFGISAIGGYDFGNGLRAEGEFGYRRNSLDQFEITNDGGLGAAAGVGSLSGQTLETDGTTDALYLMANGWYDFMIRGFRPYIGGGIGFARVSVDGSVRGVQLLDDSDTVFAYQLGAGVGFDVAPNVTVSLDYRYFATQDPELDAAGGTTVDGEYQTHNIGISARYRF